MSYSPYPITIIGSGFTGPLMALALGHDYGPLFLVDPAPLEQQLDTPSDGRAIAITQASKAFFSQLGLWELLAHHAEPLMRVITRQAAGPQVQITSDHLDGQPLGYMVDAKILKDTLLTQAHKQSHITCLTDQITHLDSESPFQSTLTVHLASGQSLGSSLVIGADGARSRVRQAANLRHYGWSYDQTAFVRVYQHDNPHHGQAYETFLPTGPFAILPLPHNRSSIVWAVPNSQAQSLGQLSSEAFDQAAFPHMEAYTNLTPQSPVWQRPLQGLWVPFFTSHRLALVGDAAHQIHPLAGQGFNLGIQDVAALAETLAEGALLGLDLGSHTLLKRYQQKQRWQHLAFLGATHGLDRLFSNDNATLDWVRQKGLQWVENTPALKRFFAHQGAGLKETVVQPG
ncbi:MAG: FAD-dependent monooxygenase [Alphaproteobacteria bacterium]